MIGHDLELCAYVPARSVLARRLWAEGLASRPRLERVEQLDETHRGDWAAVFAALEQLELVWPLLLMSGVQPSRLFLFAGEWLDRARDELREPWDTEADGVYVRLRTGIREPDPDAHVLRHYARRADNLAAATGPALLAAAAALGDARLELLRRVGRGAGHPVPALERFGVALFCALEPHGSDDPRQAELFAPRVDVAAFTAECLREARRLVASEAR